MLTSDAFQKIPDADLSVLDMHYIVKFYGVHCSPFQEMHAMDSVDV